MNTVSFHTKGKEAADALILKLEPDKLPELEIRANGVTHYKTVGWHQLLTLLDRSMVVEQLKVADLRVTKLPRLPDRTLMVDIAECSRWTDVILTGYVPATEYPMVYQGASYLVHIPTIVYRARWTLQAKRLIGLSIAVTTDSVVTEISPLYRWPYSNVFDDGRVCWTHDTVCELHEVVNRGVFGFISTPNNRDLFGVGTSQNSPYREYAAFLEAVQAHGGIPHEWLIPLGRTVAEFHNAYRAQRY
ncbi:hypothetical protein [Alicyclobacillus macrosporangiidus]|uniref:hypothetical protein n=1 Tax=Alicyclobacillus macrosporangiidus TaxID=392015 RepID=UPI00049509FA|nr:hypothetical protein [Alicyclobacillus macrosporangiidus]